VSELLNSAISGNYLSVSQPMADKSNIVARQSTDILILNPRSVPGIILQSCVLQS